MVDLSAALEEDEAARAANTEAIRAICEVEGISVDIGGRRTVACGASTSSRGRERSASSLGTVLVREPGFAEVAARAFGDLLVADVAARDGEVRVNGWREGVSRNADDVVGELASLGFKHLVFTDVARDGMQTGIDAEAYRHIAEVAGFPVVASGGISSLDDIRALAALGAGVIEGAITGRALYEGAFTLHEALDAACGGEATCSPNA